MDNNIELILKQALNKLKGTKKTRPKGACLTEMDLSCLIDGKVSELERDKFLAHVLTCQGCAELLGTHLKVINAINNKEALETPEEVVQAAIGLYNPEVGVNFLEVALNLKEKFIELVRTTGDILLGPQLVPIPALRSHSEESRFANEVKIVKEFDNILTEVGVEKKKPDICDVEIRLTDKETKKKKEGFRVTLNKNGKEIESSLIEDGKVAFKDVRPDKYVVSIIKDDKKFGIIEILITSSK